SLSVRQPTASQSLGSPVHSKPASTSQNEQPSSATRLPSSHASPASITPSPQLSPTHWLGERASSQNSPAAQSSSSSQAQTSSVASHRPLAQASSESQSSPTSIRHCALHPSPSVRLPSSHASPVSTSPLPQAIPTHWLGSTPSSQIWPSPQPSSSSQAQTSSVVSHRPLAQASFESQSSPISIRH